MLRTRTRLALGAIGGSDRPGASRRRSEPVCRLAYEFLDPHFEALEIVLVDRWVLRNLAVAPAVATYRGTRTSLAGEHAEVGDAAKGVLILETVVCHPLMVLDPTRVVGIDGHSAEPFRHCASRDEQRRTRGLVQSRSDALTGIIGARRAWTASMISRAVRLSRPYRLRTMGLSGFSGGARCPCGCRHSPRS
jgi:hypothetical protein